MDEVIAHMREKIMIPEEARNGNLNSGFLNLDDSHYDAFKKDTGFLNEEEPKGVKTEIEEKKYYNYDEKYRSFVLFAGLLLLLELILRNTIFRSFV